MSGGSFLLPEWQQTPWVCTRAGWQGAPKVRRQTGGYEFKYVDPAEEAQSLPGEEWRDVDVEAHLQDRELRGHRWWMPEAMELRYCYLCWPMLAMFPVDRSDCHVVVKLGQSGSDIENGHGSKIFKNVVLYQTDSNPVLSHEPCQCSTYAFATGEAGKWVQRDLWPKDKPSPSSTLQTKNLRSWRLMRRHATSCDRCQAQWWVIWNSWARALRFWAMNFL